MADQRQNGHARANGSGAPETHAKTNGRAAKNGKANGKKPKVVQYNCAKCPGYCCSYPVISVTKYDVERLAKHFGIGFRKARAKYTVPRDDEDYTMRRKADVHFGRVCQFFDTDERRCTIYEARPSTCRTYPGGRCGYYDFLTFERNTQDDPEHIAGTWNK